MLNGGNESGHDAGRLVPGVGTAAGDVLAGSAWRGVSPRAGNCAQQHLNEQRLGESRDGVNVMVCSATRTFSDDSMRTLR